MPKKQAIRFQAKVEAREPTFNAETSAAKIWELQSLRSSHQPINVSRGGKKMFCPNCGKEMQSGYVPTDGTPPQWIPNGKKQSLLNGLQILL